MWTFHVVAAVGDEFHLVELIAHSGIDFQFADGQRGGEIAGSESVSPLVVVAHTLLFNKVHLVGTEILLVGEQFGHVHLAETVGQRVLLHVPGVDELAGGVTA